MKLFFNHLFFRAYWWNKNIVKEKGSFLFSAVLGVSVFYVLNYVTLLFLFSLYYHNNPLAYAMQVHIIGMILIVAINYFIYSYNDNYRRVLERSKNMNKKTIRYFDIGITIYIFLTFLSFILILIKGKEFILINN